MTRVDGSPPDEVASSLEAAFARSHDQPLADREFDSLARDIFAWQFERNRPYAAWCRRRGRTPDRVSHWTSIPAVPTVAFREVLLVAGDEAAAEARFRTSGTSRGERRGTHIVPDLRVYHRSLLTQFEAMLLPDGARPAVFSIVPPPDQLPDSSLAHMIGTVIEHFGSPTSGWFATVGGGLDVTRLDHALDGARRTGESVCLLGTSFSFVHWLDALEAADRRHRLPPGSRLMDTGGFKGRSREVASGTLRAAYLDRLGIAPTHCVNEYGMTELCSQFYDSTLREAVMGRGAGERRKLAPPWVRVRIVEPATLEPVASGPGLIQVFDLANVGSVLAVQTEDLGVAVEDGFHVLGRATGAQPRGCSIAMDELLEAVGRPVRRDGIGDRR